MSDWIAISETTPFKDMPEGYVLVFDGWNEISVARFDWDSNSTQWITPQNVIIGQVTHWMRLPEMPVKK